MAKTKPRRVTDDPLYERKVIELAKMIHESARDAVLAGWVLQKSDPPREFVEWPDLPVPAIEGRCSQARYFLDGRRKSRLRELVK